MKPEKVEQYIKKIDDKSPDTLMRILREHNLEKYPEELFEAIRIVLNRSPAVSSSRDDSFDAPPDYPESGTIAKLINLIGSPSALSFAIDLCALASLVVAGTFIFVLSGQSDERLRDVLPVVFAFVTVLMLTAQWALIVAIVRRKD